MKKNRLLSFIIALGSTTLMFAQILPIPSEKPNKAQQQQINRKYGMFMHFGINTFHNMEWTDGSKPASTYTPTTIDADQWVRSAKKAGMKYVIMITKHHDGFCLWDSKYTEYDVASSPSPTNVVEAVAKACKKYNIGLGLYYSLWDRKVNADVKNTASDKAYNEYMLQQLNELLAITKKITPVVEFWFDGGWLKANHRWPVNEIYQTIKSQQPDCQIGINWSIGLPNNPDYHVVLPKDQKEGYPIRYFPSDFRLGDPFLPAVNDPKVFSHDGKRYYMPFESTICINQGWFYNTTDTVLKSVDELEKFYNIATANDNIFIINCPPNKEGRLRETDVQRLMELKARIKKNLKK